MQKGDGKCVGGGGKDSGACTERGDVKGRTTHIMSPVAVDDSCQKIT